MRIYWNDKYVAISRIYYSNPAKIVEAFDIDTGIALSSSELSALNTHLEPLLCSIYTRKVS